VDLTFFCKEGNASSILATGSLYGEKVKWLVVILTLLLITCASHKYNYESNIIGDQWNYYHEDNSLGLRILWDIDPVDDGKKIQLKIINNNNAFVEIEYNLFVWTGKGIAETGIRRVYIPPTSDGLIELEIIGSFNIKSFRFTHFIVYTYK